jgi:hypothetical protein
MHLFGYLVHRIGAPNLRVCWLIYFNPFSVADLRLLAGGITTIVLQAWKKGFKSSFSAHFSADDFRLFASGITAIL